MEFDTKIAFAIADDLATWQKLNVVAFLSSGVIGATENIMGETYVDGSGANYSPLCVQPMMVLTAGRARLNTFVQRANQRGVPVALYIEDMFATGHDAANRETVMAYASEDLPVVGIGVRAERKIVDKILKGAKMHA